MPSTDTTVSLPDGYAVLVEIDDDYNPAGSVATGDDAADAEYVARFERGEITAYGVSLVKVDEDGNVLALRYRDGSCGPIREASLWGCDVENGAADGVFSTLAEVPDDYLREIAADLIGELPAE